MAGKNDSIATLDRQQTTQGVYDKHMEDREARAALRKKTAPARRECLDPLVAAEYEQNKPKQNYEVTCPVETLGQDGKTRTTIETRKVRASSPQEAWAKFCDAVNSHPSPHRDGITIKELPAGQG